MKKISQENFPVASFFFTARNREIIKDYYYFARYCDDIADCLTLSTKEKLNRLDEAEQALYGHADVKCANLLRQSFLQECLDFSLATDLLIAFRQDSQNISYQTWSQLLDYCRYSAAPVGRFMLAIHDENPSTYIPACALCSVLQITNHLQDLKNDVQCLKRIYLPQELLKKHHVSEKMLLAASTSKSLQFLINDVLDRCQGLLKDARILPVIVKNKRLKLYLCITLSLTNILINKLYHNDILRKQVKLSRWDWVKSVVIGFYKAITIKRKTLTNKGL